jgi:transglutaminase-like putative cysteine protease
MSFDRPFLKFLLIPVMVLVSSCSKNAIVPDRTYLEKIENSFIERRQLAIHKNKELFNVFDDNLSQDQEVALKFLYAYMPLSDLADYDGRFFLENVNLALAARTAMPWGNEFPQELFIHYVLPIRINNENLDSFRIKYYGEIKNRVKGKDLKSAALEINYWCQEKVSYQPADIRTSAPLSTILSARGRCGEESTLLVAALRTAGIPARQVYVPRWAHNDDNHAWVEVWINGNWHYMGACEPEPVLDRGWFTEYAKTAMLIHTKSFGSPWGKENSINTYRNYTEVNCLSGYAQTKRLYVKVLDRNNNPAKGSIVEYRLYNYSEFFTLASVPAGEDGISSLETGLGDLLIWARDGNDFAFKKVTVGSTDTLTLRLGEKIENGYSLDMDLNIPEPTPPGSSPSAEQIEENSRRTREGNFIRKEYISSWMKPEEAVSMALKFNLDTAGTTRVISRSTGNYKEISAFLTNAPDSLKDLGLSLLEILPDKDLRDSKSYILSDHLLNTIRPGGQSDEIFLEYVLNPRVQNEMLTDWRGYLKENLPERIIREGAANPGIIAAYLNENVQISDENYYQTPITPKGVIDLKVSDENSRDICFVAICRSLGVPARLEPAWHTPQYFSNDKWNDVNFDIHAIPDNLKGYITFKSEFSPEPEYFIQFTIARLENGRYKTIDYDYNKKVSDFTKDMPVPAGSYMIVTGNRLSENKILSNITFFDLADNEHKTVEIKVRREKPASEYSGKINFDSIASLFPRSTGLMKDLRQKGAAIFWIDPDMEPTKHIFNELPLKKEELEKWGGHFLFLNSSDNNSFKPEELTGLPAGAIFSTDDKLQILKSSVKLTPSLDNSLPVIILTDKDGNILYASAGYRIGIGDMLLKYIK